MTFFSRPFIPFLLTATLFFLLSSCSQLGQGKHLDEEEETLRTITANLDSEIPWTDELESDRLVMPVHTAAGIEKRVVLSPLAVLAGGNESAVPPIFPRQEGLGLLDYRDFPAEACTLLENFCQAFIADEKTEGYVSGQGLYLLALFYRDLSERLPPKTAEDDAPDFNSYLYAAPFVSADFIQVPVQFRGDKASMTAAIFLLKEKGEWKIDQIQLRTWEVYGE